MYWTINWAESVVNGSEGNGVVSAHGSAQLSAVCSHHCSVHSSLKSNSVDNRMESLWIWFRYYQKKCFNWTFRLSRALPSPGGASQNGAKGATFEIEASFLWLRDKSAQVILGAWRNIFMVFLENESEMWRYPPWPPALPVLRSWLSVRPGRWIKPSSRTGQAGRRGQSQLPAAAEPSSGIKRCLIRSVNLIKQAPLSWFTLISSSLPRATQRRAMPAEKLGLKRSN